ncbi:MAG: Na+/H+ antiporter NhaC family protein [Bacteroidales bacterium]|nr:Na+/H+ antiporter NhaC family protein [Bacteroidales bacterium]
MSSYTAPLHSPSPTTRKGLLALSPVVVFLIVYLVVSLVIGDFYKMPLAVALLIASIWAILISDKRPLTQRIEIFSREAGHSNILYMIWIFVLAGAFASLAKELGCVEATVRLTLDFFPPRFIVGALFLASCFISLAIGTSVGTVVALTPIAVEMAQVGGENVAFFVAVVLGGAFFGDNLSFISDTTIAATRTQGCNMADKFKANLWIAVPAAIVALTFYLLTPYDVGLHSEEVDTNVWLVIPYLVIILLAVMGINVTIVLTCGILTALCLGLIFGSDLLSMASFMGQGIDSMGNLIIITLMAAGMLGVVKAQGGIQWLLERLTAKVHSSRGAKWCIASLVAIVNLCTANNTVAIITVGSISRDIAERYGVEPRRSASLLDTCSCIVQCLIPYGAQTLLATALASIPPQAPWPYLYYPWALAGVVAIAIIIGKNKKARNMGAAM